MFRAVFAPLFALCVGANLLASFGVPVSGAVQGPLAPVVIVVISITLAGFVLTGLLWLIGEAREGFRSNRA